VIDNSLTLTPAHLVQRLIDAAHWYGDASREKFPASQIVKFVTAMERILMTANEKNLTKVFCDRGSALTTFPHKDQRSEERHRFSRVYGARSNFVHGSSSPSARKYLALLPEAEELSRAVLLSALQFFDQNDRIVDRSMTDKRLGKGFERLVQCFKPKSMLQYIFDRIRNAYKHFGSYVVRNS
jgi:hypothetical protein